jgi:murein DD-endopeptidase MepM/ murein hydrolase activator NlpD
MRTRVLALCAAAAAIAAPGAAVALASDAARAGQPTGAGFELGQTRVTPATAFFDGRRPVRLRYAFRAERRLDLVIRVVERGKQRVLRRWVERDLAPGRLHRRRWDGRLQSGEPAPDSTYAFRVGPLGHRGAAAGAVELHDHAFPVAGSHSYGDTFGEPRSGGRVHEGQDLPSPCGTRLVAARGGRVQDRGYSHALYGYWVLIDGLGTRRDYFYSHLRAPTPLGDGERVRTGARVGEVGKTGNARSEFCQLHFELWPAGYRNGSPQDPAPLLRAWDGFS